MSDKTNLNVRMDREVKAGAEKVLKGLGMNMSQAVNMLAYQIMIQQGFPLELNLNSEADPFYSPYNQAVLRKSIAELNAGLGQIHELTETED